MSIEVISAFVGLILTLLVFSYLIDDNPLFRFAIYLFIGVSSGYAATAAWHYVLVPKLFSQLGDVNQLLLLIVPLVLSISLLAKLSPRLSWMGNFAMAVLVGVGAATAVGGALFGTLLPQALAAMDEFDLGQVSGSAALVRLFEVTVMFLGTVLTLVIPKDAVVLSQGGAFVCTVADSKASRKRVELGVRTPGFVEAKSGVQPGDMVVVGGLDRLVDGVSVTTTVMDRRPTPGTEAGADSTLRTPPPAQKP